MSGDLQWGKRLICEDGEVKAPLMYGGGWRSCCASSWSDMKAYAAQHGIADPHGTVWPEYYPGWFSIVKLRALTRRLIKKLYKLPPGVIEGNGLLREIWDLLRTGHIVWYIHG